MQKHEDSTGKPIRVGDMVRYRGFVYKIKAFGEMTEWGSVVEFVGTDIKGEEFGIDLVGKSI
jgi:hypothetical protein